MISNAVLLNNLLEYQKMLRRILSIFSVNYRLFHYFLQFLMTFFKQFKYKFMSVSQLINLKFLKIS